MENGATFLPLPNFRKGGKNFQKLWEATFRPLRDWLGDASLYLAAEVAQKFSDFRRSKGYVTYDDMVTLAAQLLRDRSIGAHIRAQRHCVILDEAQDTDRQQFEILLELARPEEVRGNSIENDPPAPGRGRFCMVGDPQQSIYGDRADLPTYLEIHQRLVTSAAVEALHFGVLPLRPRDRRLHQCTLPQHPHPKRLYKKPSHLRTVTSATRCRHRANRTLPPQDTRGDNQSPKNA